MLLIVETRERRIPLLPPRPEPGPSRDLRTCLMCLGSRSLGSWHDSEEGL